MQPTPHFTGSADARPSKSAHKLTVGDANDSVDLLTPPALESQQPVSVDPGAGGDAALESAIQAVGSDPERAADLAIDLGVGATALIPDRNAIGGPAESDINQLARDLSKDAGFCCELAILLDNLREATTEDADPKAASNFYAALFGARMYQAGISGRNAAAALSPDGASEDADDVDEDDGGPGWDEWTLRTLHNTRMEAPILDFDAPGEQFLKSVVLAFCSNADLNEDEAADISARPDRADRRNKNLHFSVGTDGFSAWPTRTGFTFAKGDDLEVGDVDRNYDYLENEIVLVVHDARLTLCELHETRDKDKDGDNILRLFNLRTGTFLPSNAVLIIGSLKSTQRRYKRPEAPYDRAMARLRAESSEAERKSKSTDHMAASDRVVRLLDQYIAEEEQRDACGDEHEGYRCSLRKGHDGDHVAELDGEGEDQTWPRTIPAASADGSR